ncbi:serine hydrolase [Hyphomonas sp.]|uniref:serine hydrolase n=1 Tax=Hyphomonas sp. TaxID=87 RepID=UPI001DC84D54|nr:serine hydrolase [Hyphomonas sp.]MBU4062836.1 serine hydrolase [Alphaproteobacteria bacterium]MBU4163755.1 serine hydrolase [Alphaproteobacteria bacterium]
MSCRQTISLLVSASLMIAATAGQAAADPVAGLSDDARVGRFSGVVAAAEYGALRIVDARGLASADGEIANGTRVAYPLASVTKVLTATAVMRLVEDGRIDLAAAVETYLPEYADRPFARVTIAQLLSHTGGVPSLLKDDQGLGDGPPDFDALSRPTGTADLIDQFSAAPLLFEPGARYGYSNSGYILLGRIINVVTVTPYYQALDDLVLAPAGVSDAFCLCRDLPGYPDATAFERHGDSFASAPVIHPSQMFSAGGVRATPEGLLQWSEALMSGRILRPETLERMWTPVAATRRPGESFSLGWLVREVDGIRQVAHDGAMPGAVGYLVLTPADHRATFGELNHTLDLDNLSDSETYLRRVVSSVAAGRDPATVPALASSMAAPALAGTYHLPEDRSFTLQTDAQGQLWLETDGHWSALQLPKLVHAEGPLAADAEAAITGWATNGQPGLAPYFSPDMAANLPTGALDGAWSQFIEQFGAYRSHHVYAVSGDFAEVRIDFARGAMDIGIVYDAEGRINGLQPVGQETEMPATRVRAWVTTDGGLWIDGYAHAGPDVAAMVDSDGGLSFASGQYAARQPVR